ncbi:MAG TPA: flagellar motor protein MotB [Nannocystaceae bacterium]|nr:flagellar motor protein MotB [Nannocystaceae bacterium]
MRNPALVALVLSLATGGCVTKSVHDATLRDLAAARRSALQEASDNADLAEQLRADESRLTDLQGALTEQEDLLSSLTVERAKLAQELALAKQALATLEARASGAERELAESMKTRAKLEESVDRMREALGVLAARHVAAQARVTEYRQLLARFEQLIDAGTLDVRISEGRMVLTMPMDVLFASGSATLSRAGKDTIVQVGAALATITDKRFQVEGHTDDVPIHNELFASNWELAAGRALVVVHTLLDTGMAPTQLSAASFGEFKPRAANRDDASRAGNRRIEIVVVPDLDLLPGNEELEQISQGS